MIVTCMIVGAIVLTPLFVSAPAHCVSAVPLEDFSTMVSRCYLSSAKGPDTQPVLQAQVGTPGLGGSSRLEPSSPGSFDIDNRMGTGTPSGDGLSGAEGTNSQSGSGTSATGNGTSTTGTSRTPGNDSSGREATTGPGSTGALGSPPPAGASTSPVPVGPNEQGQPR